MTTLTVKAGAFLDRLVEEHIFGFKWNEDRCRICGWPLYKDIKDGCVSENCSLRPAPERHADKPSPFSTDDTQAFRLLRKMAETWTDISVESAGLNWQVKTPIAEHTDTDLRVALCVAALRSVNILPGSQLSYLENRK